MVVKTGHRLIPASVTSYQPKTNNIVPDFVIVKACWILMLRSRNSL